MSNKNNLTGQRFGRLLVIKQVESVRYSSATHSQWLCKCDCGNEIIARGCSLSSNHTKSCGCLKRDIQKSRMIKANTKHGLSRCRLYETYLSMKRRCYLPTNKDYERYGRRGISICDEWKESFEAFYDWAIRNGYRDDLTIDRIDVDGNYCPENCRWATRKEQSNNKTNTVRYTAFGETHTLSEWSDITGISRNALYTRLHKYHWGMEKSLTTEPRRSYGRRKNES